MSNPYQPPSEVKPATAPVSPPDRDWVYWLAMAVGSFGIASLITPTNWVAGWIYFGLFVFGTLAAVLAVHTHGKHYKRYHERVAGRSDDADVVPAEPNPYEPSSAELSSSSDKTGESIASRVGVAIQVVCLFSIVGFVSFRLLSFVLYIVSLFFS